MLIALYTNRLGRAARAALVGGRLPLPTGPGGGRNGNATDNAATPPTLGTQALGGDLAYLAYLRRIYGAQAKVAQVAAQERRRLMTTVHLDDPPSAQRRANLIRSLVHQLNEALNDLERQELVIQRLEAGERRWQCAECGVFAWTPDGEPPRHWSGPPLTCRDCAQSHEFDPHTGPPQLRPAC